MTREDKELLLKDISARLLYGVNGLAYIVGEPCNINTNIVGIIDESIATNYESPILGLIDLDSKDITIKPYLRSMSSMTEEERNEYLSIKMQETERVALEEVYRPEAISEIIDWLNEHHFDYRGLIERGLALEAPKGMYK